MLRSLYSGLLSLVLLISTAIAQQTQTLLPTENASWQMHVNVKNLFASPLGGMINDLIKEKHQGQHDVSAIVEAMGFDPRTAVGKVVMFGDDFEHTSVTVIANLGASRGNVEGWLLAAPGYKSEDIDDHTLVHSFVVEEDDMPRMWCAIPKTNTDNSYVFVGSFNRDTTVALAKKLQEQGTDNLGEQLSGNTFLSLAVNDLSKAPIEIEGDEPGSGLIEIIKSISLAAASEKDNLNIQCEVSAESPARAQQLNQLLVGMKAMVQLAVPEKDAKAKEFAKLLNNLNVEYAEGTSNLSANFSIGYDVIQQMIEAKHGHGHH